MSGGSVVGMLSGNFGTLTVAGTMTSMTENFNGMLPNGSPFTRMPTACTPATATLMTVAYSGATESGTAASPDVPTVCGSLPYAPAFSASAVKDAGDNGAAVTTAITQGAGQAASNNVVLSVPSSTLSPNLGLLSVVCNNANLATCPASSTVGTVFATSPLLPIPLTGKVIVTHGAVLPDLTLYITSPYTVALPGVISLTSTGVSTTFANVPDIPLSSLIVALSGGPTAAFTATCAQSSAAIGGAFAGWNAKTANLNAPITVKGCSSTGAGKPKLSGVSLSGTPTGHPKLHFKLTHGSGAPNLSSLSVGLPSLDPPVSRRW